MLTPTAFRNIIKHFDEIDKIVSSKTIRKRPWFEVSLTSLLCDLLDEETQEEDKLNYTFKHLQEDLDKEDSLIGINLSVETTEFNSAFENHISQSDVGINLVFENMIEPNHSWIRSYLLQAKRLFPKNNNPLTYSENAEFSSQKEEQKERIKILNTVLGASHLKFLLFCPRPDDIDEDTKIKLAYLRNCSLSTGIFDFTDGLEIHNSFLVNNNSLKAGIFVTDADNSNFLFGDVHKEILKSTFPLSWFVALNFLERSNFLSDLQSIKISSSEEGQKLVEGILSGDKTAIEEVLKRVKEITGKESNFNPENIQIIPKHKITIKLDFR
jgi:hypothetical protein